MDLAIAICSLVFAAIPAVLFRRNLTLYRTPQSPVPMTVTGTQGRLVPISVLIPARNEAGNVRGAVEAVLASRDVDLEVVVLDDHSTDGTAEIVRELAARDPRVRLESAPELPTGWCGKQHACWILARAANRPVFCFLDADVRLSAEALSRMSAFLDSSGAALVSGFPRQITGSLLEKLLIPMIHFILLGFLPFVRMRASKSPAYAAGCGQLMMVRGSAYFNAGGHAAIRGSLHDGLKLPRALRASGFATDLFDATELATCRMYSSAREVWSGLAKNATEGMAAPSRIGLFTFLLLAGQVLPFFLLLTTHGLALPISAVAALLAWYPRFAAVRRFRQPMVGAILHPVGVLLLLLIQWYALVRSALGWPAAWKGRAYAPAA